MNRRTIMIVLAWVGSTLVALVAATAAVSVVAEQVSTELPPPLPSEYLPAPSDPALALSASASPKPTETSTSGSDVLGTGTTRTEPSSSSTGPAVTPAPGQSSPPSSTTGPTPGTSPTPNSPSPSPTPAVTPTESEANEHGSEHETDDDGSTETDTPSSVSETRTVHAIGGSTALRFENGKVTVLWATPKDGYTLSIEGNGTTEVRVRFRSDSHRSEIEGQYEDGEPDIEVDEGDG